MNASEVLQLLDEAKGLRELVPTILTQTSPEVIEVEINKRSEHRNKLQRMADTLSDEIAEKERLKRYIRTAKSETATDNDKLDARRWELIRSRPKQ